jgi:hypothetical protein
VSNGYQKTVVSSPDATTYFVDFLTATNRNIGCIAVKFVDFDIISNISLLNTCYGNSTITNLILSNGFVVYQMAFACVDGNLPTIAPTMDLYSLIGFNPQESCVSGFGKSNGDAEFEIFMCSSGLLEGGGNITQYVGPFNNYLLPNGEYAETVSFGPYPPYIGVFLTLNTNLQNTYYYLFFPTG